MRTFFVETWGCQMNQHDSELIEGQLRRHGLEPAPSANGADLVVLNTCSVRDKPVQKIISRIGALAKSSPRTTIGVCGCVAEQEGGALLDRSHSVGFVLGPGQAGRIGEAVRALTQGERPVFTGFDAETEHNHRTIFRKSSTRGMVTVIEGCNEFCTFCIVPYTRGREVSRPLDGILDEVRRLAADGVREVELLGQTINAYRCPRTGADLAGLLERVAGVDGLLRVRFITSHPRHFDQGLIDVIAAKATVFSYLHLPIQSGSDPVLKRMHRRYTRGEYLDLVARIRAASPEINLSTDIIVGFPGESEADFEATLAVLDEVRFGQVFAFGFSPRPRTPAARYRPRVPDEVVSERLQRLFAMTDRISLELNQELVGRRVQVLIDGPSRRDPSHWQGRGEDNRVVNFPALGREGVGDLVEVEILRAGPHALAGEIVAGAVRLPVLP
ncbi:MAG TPA: tRNA (N6-isopentenyl adenosine(37)-C2)-methylthiotransferase MiaB [Methylomirabilota bacterium]|nr:tRNA (N6-isopentenyl adenosine(37)-C2)-methylthiotransferase MiaB [Methylomirabilota bacterium]